MPPASAPAKSNSAATGPGPTNPARRFASIGADVLDVSHTETGAGDAAVVTYSLSVSDRTIEGVSYLVNLGDEIVTVTVSTPDRGQTDEIGATIGETLDEAS